MVPAWDPEAPPLTFPEQCQILVLGDRSGGWLVGEPPQASKQKALLREKARVWAVPSPSVGEYGGGLWLGCGSCCG